jgi:hypothetical protein
MPIRLLHHKIHMPTVTDLLAGDRKLDMYFFYRDMNWVFDFEPQRDNLYNIPENEIIELDISEFLALPRQMRNQLIERRLMLTSAIDFHRAVIKMDEILGTQRPNVVYVTSNHSEASRHAQTFYINPWPLCNSNSSATARAMVADPEPWLEKIERGTYSRWCFFPNYKARDHRVVMLAALEDRGHLDHTEWSLGADQQGHHSHLMRFDLKPSHPRATRFLEQHQTQLPRKLPIPEGSYSDLVYISPEWPGQYDHMIAGETDVHSLFLTEKTYRGFQIGATTWVLGHYKSHQRLKREGFHVAEFDPENLSIDQTCDSLIDHMKQYSLTPQQRMENFERMTNREWLKNQVLDGYNRAIRKLRTIEI